MADSQASVETVVPSLKSPVTSQEPGDSLTSHDHVSIFVLHTHLTEEELHEVQDQIRAAGGIITNNVFEAHLALTAISSPRRARFELQIRGVDVSSLEGRPPTQAANASVASPSSEPAEKRRKLASLSWIPRGQSGDRQYASKFLASWANLNLESHGHNVLLLLRLDWFFASVRAGRPLPINEFAVLEGSCERSAKTSTPLKFHVDGASSQRSSPDKAHQHTETPKEHTLPADTQRPAGGLEAISPVDAPETSRKPASPAILRHDSTADHEVSSQPNEMPRWVTEKKIYACERPTPPHSPNAGFIEELRRIRLVRNLTLDEIGVRAYSTSIASLAAFPRPLTNSQQVLALPGCDQKIARLFREYQELSFCKAAEESRHDTALSAIEQFHDIWGVGTQTARGFYFDRGWRSLDDVIDKGWETLSRVQKLGLKYYEEFALAIPRSEVEYIASVVTYHARKIVDEGIESIIVGGYRRGKVESADVDIVLSHRREDATAHLVAPLVQALETAGWITHLLSFSESNSTRGQEPPLMRPPRGAGRGLDALDKALVIWQDPIWSSKEHDLSVDSEARNPNPHRRVDIIITPWRTVGCAVTGWTSGTTFQRDLRRYAKNVKGWKFDSSGVRNRATGQWVDLEDFANEKTRAKTWQEAERRVFEGLGLTWREPWERCTD